VRHAYAAPMRRVLIGLMLFAAACSAGPTAPPIEGTEIACVGQLCVAYPSGWDVESGDTYLAFSNPAAPGEALATAAPVNMQALVEAAGEAWPAPADDVARAFWTLLGESGDAELERVERLTGGTIRSEGVYGDGRLWHLLIPGSGTEAVAIEVRGPNRTWSRHAEVFFEDLEPSG
jgi:hypothetical protein